MTYAAKPITAEERVKAVQVGIPDHPDRPWQVQVDGELFAQFDDESSARHVERRTKLFHYDIVEKCCAAICEHCKAGVPIRYVQHAIYHDDKKSGLLCKAVRIRSKLGVKP